jgi:hypothetical protein
VCPIGRRAGVPASGSVQSDIPVTSQSLTNIVGAAASVAGSAYDHANTDLVPVAPTTRAGRTAAAQGTGTSSRAGRDAELGSEFKRHVDRYMRLHDKIQAQRVRQQQRDDIGEIPALEYRIVDTHLVLIDVDANIVVDYMLDVVCRAC